jgi:hypothetical protein
LKLKQWRVFVKKILQRKEFFMVTDEMKRLLQWIDTLLANPNHEVQMIASEMQTSIQELIHTFARSPHHEQDYETLEVFL